MIGRRGAFIMTRGDRPRERVGRRVPGGIRTPNLLIRSQLLYPVELQTQSGWRVRFIADVQQRQPTANNPSRSRIVQSVDLFASLRAPR